MTLMEETYLRLINKSCHTGKYNNGRYEAVLEEKEFSGELAGQLLQLAEKQYTVPFLLEFLRGTSGYEYIKHQSKMMMFNYYQIEQFTYRTTCLLEKAHIPYILLKGISLAACYPVPEYRKLGDLDILILDTDKLELAKKILLENGYEPEEEECDHHLTYFYKFANGRRHMLELHYRIVGFYQYAPANRVIDRVFAPQRLQPVCQNIEGRDYPVLPPTEYVFYMLHHMLKHYLYDGFGVRLLCDFSLYTEEHMQDIDFEQLKEWCRKSGMDYFCAVVIACCKLYLGLSEKVPELIPVKAAECDELMEQILGGHDVGNEKQSSLIYSGSYRKANLAACFKEGHTQMKVRYPKLSKCILLWPFLWGMTFYYFMKNTYNIRHTTLRQTIRDFKADNQKSESLHIFENREH